MTKLALSQKLPDPLARIADARFGLDQCNADVAFAFLAETAAGEETHAGFLGQIRAELDRAYTSEAFRNALPREHRPAILDHPAPAVFLQSREERILETGETSVLALAYEWRGHSVVTLHNLSDRRVQLTLPAAEIPPELTPLLCDDNARNPCRAEDPIPLAAYGFRWFRADGERR